MTVHVESVGAAVIVTLDRPETKNAIDRQTAETIGATVRLAAEDPSVRGVVLTGAGDAVFASGGDLKEFGRLPEGAAGARVVLDMFEAVSAIEIVDIPVIAAVQGDVLGGGCELVLLCDLVIAEEHAGFEFRHARMGLTPAWGGLTRLLERAGPLEAARLLLTAERVDAPRARAIGLVNDVVPKGTSRERAIALVDRISQNPRATVAALKRGLREVREARRGDAIEREREAFCERWDGPDHRAAMKAVATKKS